MYLPHAQGSGFPFVEFDISQTANAGAPVLCAWPLSGQYGVGSRYLYYALVLVSIFFLKTDWMRGAATAAALIYAAVAALHAIVLAVYSQKHVVDMDIFGAFQILAIGILSAPITVRYSRVYFQADGRNIIFLWTLLMIAGLLSLVACFARATEQTCVKNGMNVTISAFTANMSSSDLDLCDLRCEDAFSPIRQDPQNPAQYILVPHKGMTLDTATLLCAACCIPALLSIIVMWQKVVKYNWQLLYGTTHEETPSRGPLPSPMLPESGSARENRLRREEKKMDAIIKRGLNLVERIVYCVCILTIVVLGEENFWSAETRLGVEPMSSVGQWAPIVGAVFAALGSAYTSWLSPRVPDVVQTSMPRPHIGSIRLPDSPASRITRELPSSEMPTMPVFTRDRPRRRSSTLREEIQHHRQQVARGLEKVVALTTPTLSRFADDITQTPGHDQYWDYPLIPGEQLRSDHWQQDVIRHAEMTGRSRSAQSLVTNVSGTSVASHGSQDARPVLARDSSALGLDSGFLMVPTGSSSQFPSRSSFPPASAAPESSESAVEDEDAIIMVPRSSVSMSSRSSSPPVIVVTPDESSS